MGENENSDWDWIALDPVSGSFGTYAQAGQQNAVIFSRTPTLSSTIINAKILLWKAEGYTPNATNFYTFDFSDCEAN